MFDAIIKGFSFGVLLSFLVGPIFFVLIETSLKRGVKPALALDLGVLVSDIFYILLAYNFSSFLISLKKHENILSAFGGIIFIVFGLVSMLKLKKGDPLSEETQRYGKRDYLRFFIKGFLLNMFNPSVIFYWLGLFLFGGQFGFSPNQMLVFFLSILVSFFSIDLLKILGAGQLKSFMTDKRLTAVNRVIGITLMVFGVVMIIKGFGIFDA
ncbi:MAG TPA: LysE family transporter [Flavobacteriales bacterium]|nr:LysE family transporter [Flavobacteriales bacterium]